MAVGQIISRAIAQGAVTSDDIGALEITHAKLHTDMDLSSKTVTMPAVIRGPATLTIDPAAVGDNTGLVVIAGDLQVDGTTTTINSTTMTVDDKNIVLASGAGNSAAADGAGLTIDGASATMLYTHATTSIDFNKTIKSPGATFTGDVTFTGDNYNVLWDKSDDALVFADSSKAKFGTDGDLEIYHNNSNAFIYNDTGHIYIHSGANNKDIIFKGNDGGVTKEAGKFDMSASGKLKLNEGFEVASNGNVTLKDGVDIIFEGATDNSYETTLYVVDPTADRTVLLPDASGTLVIADSSGNVGIGTTDGDVTNDNTAARTYVSIIGTANRGRLNIGSTASNGADAGTLAFTNGTNSLADISVDTNSGVQNAGKMYINSTDLIRLSTAGSPRMHIDSSGNVGIGTTNPSTLLDVRGKVSVAYDSGNHALRLYNQSRNNWSSLSNMQTNNSADIVFKSGTGSMTFTHAGSLGIGTASPQDLLHLNTLNSASHLRLQRFEQDGALVDGDEIGGIEFWANDSTSFSGASTLRAAIRGEIQNTSLGTRLEFWTGNSNAVVAERMRIIADGNVGIGTTGPVTKLDISAGTASGTMYNALILRGGQNSTQGSGVRLHMTGTENDPLNRGVILQSEMTNNGNNHDFSVWTSQASSHTKKFTIDNQGQVAIGTDAPSGTRLHIKVPSSSGGLINAVKIQDSGGYVDIEMHAGAADGEIRLGSAGQLRGKISGAGVGSSTYHNFDLYQNSTTAARLMSSINSTGRRGLTMLGNSLGFDQSGVRSWEMRAEGGNLRMDAGDGYGKVQVSAGFKAKSIQLGSDSANSTFGAQSGYIGDWWEAGHKVVYYLGYLGSSASSAGTANWFNFYTSGHWGQYTRVMVYSINHYPSPGYSKWDINGSTAVSYTHLTLPTTPYV